MEGLDLGQTSNPSLAWKNGRFQINDDDAILQSCNKTSAVPGCSSLRSTSMVHGDCCAWPQNGMEFESSCSYWTAMTFELRDLSVPRLLQSWFF